jgi:hypothetical protein
MVNGPRRKAVRPVQRLIYRIAIYGGLWYTSASALQHYRKARCNVNRSDSARLLGLLKFKPFITEVRVVNDTATVVIAPMCRHGNSTVEAPVAGLLAWMDGKKIQHALPELSADQREMLMSGICPVCWDETFGDAACEN